MPRKKSLSTLTERRRRQEALKKEDPSQRLQRLANMLRNKKKDSSDSIGKIRIHTYLVQGDIIHYPRIPTVQQNATNTPVIKTEEDSSRDEHFFYGEYIANRFRSCKRDISDIGIAKDHIDNIMNNLSMGAYSSARCPKGEQQTGTSLRKLAKNIIVKKEPDL